MLIHVLIRTILVAALCGCAGAAVPPAGQVRFRNQPPVWVVNDRRDVPRKPDTRRFLLDFHHWDGRWYRRIDRWLQMRPPARAVDVNSLDEAPDSTWFTNRIGVRDLTAAEITTGPNIVGSPQAHLPFTVKSAKAGGVSIGFVVVDRRGIRYVLKFEDRGIPEMETAAAIITQRLLWAAGYNVPEDHLVRVRREDLVLAPDAVIQAADGGEDAMTAEFVDRALARAEADTGGSYRALASQFLPGAPIGGHARDGVRDDDPNDRVPHQLRRALRGARAIFSWLDHTDIKESNTVDVYVEDPAERRVHYVVHYMIDFGKALGARAYIDCRTKEHRRCRTLELPTVALTADDFRPGAWHALTRSYFPFLDADRFDNFWGASIVARFSREQILAAVRLGGYSDPRAVDRVVDLLVQRQRAVARHWFERVNPVDRFEVSAAGGAWRLCFDDLAVKVGLAPASGTQYRARAFDHQGRPTGWRTGAAAADDGRACVSGVAPSASPEQYTIVELATERGARLPVTLVHLARDPATGAPRVIGLDRR
jgi:hypothetical protein